MAAAWLFALALGVLVGQACLSFSSSLTIPDRVGSGTGITNHESHVFYMLWLINVAYNLSAVPRPAHAPDSPG